MRRHLELIGYGPGAVELVAGTNRPSNPEKIDLITYDKKRGQATSRKWILAERLAELAQNAECLAKKWGNVYISVGTYGKTENPYRPGTIHHSREAPLPRRCVIADDVTDLSALPLPPTWATETSPGNYQVGYTCDELLSPQQAERLAAGLALLMGADPSGWDAQQLIRMTGTLNTKAKCAGSPGDPANGIEPEGWRVRLRVEGPRHSMEALASAFLPGGLADLRRAQGAGSRRKGGKVAYDPAAWENLPDGEALMGSARFQGFFKSRFQLAALARGERVTLITRYGDRDSGSEQVAVLVSNLLSTGRRNEDGDFIPGLGAPPLAEIRAVALYWRETLRPECDLGRYKADVDRLLRPVPDGYQPAGYAPEPTRSLAGAAVSPTTLPPAQHKLPGRPAGQRADNARRLAELLAARVGDEVQRPAVAAALGLKVRQVANLLNDLQAAPWVELELCRTRYGLRVIRCAINPPAPDVQSPPEAEASEVVSTPNDAGTAQGCTHRPDCTPERVTEPAPTMPAELATNEQGLVEDGSSRQGQAGGVFSPSSRPAAPTLRDLVADALDAYGTKGGVAALRRVELHVRKVGGLRCSPAVIERAYRAELERRKRARADAALATKAERMSVSKRRQRLRNLERRIADDLALAALLRRQPYLLDPITGEPTTERRSERHPETLEARVWVWARQYAIIARVHEGAMLAALDEQREGAALLALAEEVLTRGRAAAQCKSVSDQVNHQGNEPCPTAVMPVKPAPSTWNDTVHQTYFPKS